MKAYSNNARDRAIADESGYAAALMCCANGCPNRWTVDAGNGKCCSAHQWADRHAWPAVTQEQLDAETDRAMRNAAPAAPEHRPRVDVRKILQSLRTMLPAFGRAKPSLQWALKLQERERSGERLTITQREMWRSALGVESVEQQPSLLAPTVPMVAAEQSVAPEHGVEGDFDEREVPVEAYDEARS